MTPDIIASLFTALFVFVGYSFVLNRLKLTHKKLNAELKAEERLSETDAQKLIKEKFPWYFPIFIVIKIAVVIFLISYLSFVVLFLNILKLQEFWLGSNDLITFLPNEGSLIIMSIACFFSVLPVSLVIFALLTAPFPRIYRYFERFSTMNGSRLNPKYFMRDIIIIIKLQLLILLVTLPIIVITFFNYQYVDPSGIYYYRFLGLSDKQYNWSEISKVVLRGSSRIDGSQKKVIRFDYILLMSDGREINLWESNWGTNADKLILIRDTFIPKNTPVEKDYDSVFTERMLEQYVNHPKLEIIKDLYEI